MSVEVDLVLDEPLKRVSLLLADEVVAQPSFLGGKLEELSQLIVTNVQCPFTDQFFRLLVEGHQVGDNPTQRSRAAPSDRYRGFRSVPGRDAGPFSPPVTECRAAGRSSHKGGREQPSCGFRIRAAQSDPRDLAEPASREAGSRHAKKCRDPFSAPRSSDPEKPEDEARDRSTDGRAVSSAGGEGPDPHRN